MRVSSKPRIFPTPSVEALDREEIELFCREAGYEARFVARDFRPKSADDRLLLAPPRANQDVSNWQDQEMTQTSSESAKDTDEDHDADGSIADLDAVRRRLEGLL